MLEHDILYFCITPIWTCKTSSQYNVGIENLVTEDFR